MAIAIALTAGGCAGWPRAERPDVEAGAPIVPAQPVPPAARTTLQAPSSVAPAQLPPPQAAPPAPPSPPSSSGAPSTAAADPPAAARPSVEPSPVVAPMPGLYRCESDRRAVIRRVSDDGQRIVLGWAGTDHTMVAVLAGAGAPRRWQDARAGLAWIVTDGHALLLDLRQGRTLAKDCRL